LKRLPPKIGAGYQTADSLEFMFLKKPTGKYRTSVYRLKNMRRKTCWQAYQML